MDPLMAELLRQINDLQRRVKALEEKEFAIMHSGDGDPVHAAAESVLYWDYANDCLWVNMDGSTTWCLIGCCGQES